jgi:release factor glutamine methyltransferase
MTNISDAIKKSTEILRQSGIVEPRREANSLLSFAINKDRAFLIAYPEYELTETEEKAFREFVERRSKHEPFQHISGKQEFFGLDFLVTPDVLVPRPETELIVGEGIKILQNLEDPIFCEVGIGSGCIAASILHEIENITATGLDISENALQIAKKNAERNGVLGRLNLKLSDVFEVLEKNDRFDLIVSNPPYVPSTDIQTLQAEVRDFDPHIALTDGKDGLSIIRKIIKESPDFLKQNGSLLMEIGFNQSNKVSEMFSPEIWQAVEFFPDLQGIPRMVKAVKK